MSEGGFEKYEKNLIIAIKRMNSSKNLPNNVLYYVSFTFENFNHIFDDKLKHLVSVPQKFENVSFMLCLEG